MTSWMRKPLKIKMSKLVVKLNLFFLVIEWHIEIGE